MRAGDPNEGDPNGGDPSGGDPSGADPSGVDSSGVESLGADDGAIQTASPLASDAMALIHAAAFPAAEVWKADVFRAQLALPGVSGLIHADGGLILCRVAADEAEILTFAVAPAVRRRGIGAALLHRAIALLRQGGAAMLFLEVAVDNAAALALYRQAGFGTVGRRRGYYADGRDALVLRRNLTPGSA